MTLMSKRSLKPIPGTRLSMADLMLLRIASGPAIRAELQRDLGSVFGGKNSGTAFRRAAEMALDSLKAGGHVVEVRGRLTATDRGSKVAEAHGQLPRPSKTGWVAARDGLVGRALSIDPVTASKAFDRIETLSGLVLQQHFDISMTRALSMTDLRSELAVVALERAFGNKIKTGLRKTQGLPAKAGRLLAGQLFKPAREFASDGKLIVALAVEVAGANDSSIESLKIALLRRLVEIDAAPGEASPVRSGQQRSRTNSGPRPANDSAPADLFAPLACITISPDLGEFSGAVLDAARPISEGWPGNRKAFISRVWRAIRDTRPDWDLSEIAFKGMLAEAHRTGTVVLSSADLKDKCDLDELESSKILYKNTVWHFVRVED